MNRRLFLHFRTLCIAILLFMFSAGLLSGAVEGTGKEYKVKAAFMVNFAKLISWPEEAFKMALNNFLFVWWDVISSELPLQGLNQGL